MAQKDQNHKASKNTGAAVCAHFFLLTEFTVITVTTLSLVKHLYLSQRPSWYNRTEQHGVIPQKTHTQKKYFLQVNIFRNVRTSFLVPRRRLKF